MQVHYHHHPHAFKKFNFVPFSHSLLAYAYYTHYTEPYHLEKRFGLAQIKFLQGLHHCRCNRCLLKLWSGTTLRWTFFLVPCLLDTTDNSRPMGRSRCGGWFAQAQWQLTKKRSYGLQQQQQEIKFCLHHLLVMMI